MELFLMAARNKFRFSSSKGDLTAEQLWDLPLSSKSGFDLDSVAKSLNAELKSLAEESFVKTVSPKKGELEAKFELVKQIIATRIQENEAANAAIIRKEKLRKLEELLDKKREAALGSLSEEELQAQIAALKG